MKASELEIELEYERAALPAARVFHVHLRCFAVLQDLGDRADADASAIDTAASASPFGAATDDLLRRQGAAG